jgi:hypothetical protein
LEVSLSATRKDSAALPAEEPSKFLTTIVAGSAMTLALAAKWRRQLRGKDTEAFRVAIVEFVAFSPTKVGMVVCMAL